MTFKSFNEQLNSSSCPACDSIQSIKLFDSKVKDYSFAGFTYLQCGNCSSIFLQAPNEQIKSQEDATRFHVERWREAKAFSFQPALNFEERIQQTNPIALDYKKTFEELIGAKPYKVLDFGCGEGHLVTALLSLGVDAYGIEPDENALKRARLESSNSEKSRFFVGGAESVADETILNEIEQSNISKNQFDVIILNDVLEHLYEPKKFLESLSNLLLKPGGYIWISVPSASDQQIEILKEYAWSIMAPFHRTLFSPQGLNKVMTSLKFDVVKTFNSTERWGWTRAIAWEAGFAEDHEQLRKSNPKFKKFDYLLDKLLNEVVLKNNSSVDLRIIAKKT